jgi:hypothetical protein
MTSSSRRVQNLKLLTAEIAKKGRGERREKPKSLSTKLGKVIWRLASRAAGEDARPDSRRDGGATR